MNALMVSEHATLVSLLKKSSMCFLCDFSAGYAITSVMTLMASSSTWQDRGVVS